MATIAPARKGIPSPDRRPASDLVQVYRARIPYRCAADCGESIRWGQPYIQTSPDRHPLENAHFACVQHDLHVLGLDFTSMTMATVRKIKAVKS